MRASLHGLRAPIYASIGARQGTLYRTSVQADARAAKGPGVSADTARTSAARAGVDPEVVDLEPAARPGEEREPDLLPTHVVHGRRDVHLRRQPPAGPDAPDESIVLQP